MRASAAVEERFAGRLSIGIGINSGPVIAGSIGGGGRLEFTVIGDPVNVAARVERATRQTGDVILLTEATRCLLVRSHDDLESRGVLAAQGQIRRCRAVVGQGGNQGGATTTLSMVIGSCRDRCDARSECCWPPLWPLLPCPSSHPRSCSAPIRRSVRASSRAASSSRSGGVATDNAGRVYVADTGAGHIEVFDSGESGNTFLRTIGDGILKQPVDVEVDLRNRIFVTDQASDKVVEFDTLNSGAPFMRDWGGSGTELNRMSGPRFVHTDTTGLAFNTEAGNVRVQWFAPKDKQMVAISAFGTADPPTFNNPEGLTLDEATRQIYVSNYSRRRRRSARLRQPRLLPRPGRGAGQRARSGALAARALDRPARASVRHRQRQQPHRRVHAVGRGLGLHRLVLR